MVSVYNCIKCARFLFRPMNVLTKQIKRQKIPGNTFGLSAVLDSELDDYAYPIRNNEGFDVNIY